MTATAIEMLVAGLLAVGLFWTLPRRWAQTGVAALTLTVLAWLAPLAAAWLGASILLVAGTMGLGPRAGAAAVPPVIALLAGLFFVSREIGGWTGAPWVTLGGAYFTLRHIHVLVEWRIGRIAAPSLGDYARYHLFLPLLIAGPIHRFDHFQRQIARRRWSAGEMFTGAERVLLGVFSVTVIGDYLIGGLISRNLAALELRGSAALWLGAAVDWLKLYAQFAGFTAIALGTALMMGLRLEENFNRPWRARDLVAFWTRWHMTLSFWCRDYVFQPVSAWTRTPLLGLVAAMLVVGLWHETSLYYVLWSVYQALGILICHLYRRAEDPLRLGRLPDAVRAVLGPAFVLAWLSGVRPVVTPIVEWVLG